MFWGHTLLILINLDEMLVVLLTWLKVFKETPLNGNISKIEYE